MERGKGTSHSKRLQVSDRWRELAQTKTWVQIFEGTAARYSDREALVSWETQQRFIYSEYQENVTAMAKALYGLGVRKGTHVGIWMTNRPEWCFARLAIYKLGAVMVPLHTRYRLEEMRYVLNQSDTEILLMEEKFLGKIEALTMLLELVPEIKDATVDREIRSEDFPALKKVILVDGEKCSGTYSLDEIIETGEKVDDAQLRLESSPQDTIHIIYTSGTTGFPKGVVTPNSCNVAYSTISSELYNLTPDSRVLNLMPLFGNIGLWNHTLPLLVGGALVIGPSRFDPEETMKIAQQERVTHCIFVPTMLLDVLNHPNADKYDLSSFRRITAAGAVVPQTLIQSAKEKLGIYLMNIYGLAEASGLSTWVPYGDTPEHIEKSVGLPMPHCELAILDPKTGDTVAPGVEGEICTKEVFSGSQHMKGYYRKPDLTAETIKDGWLHSGDLGRMDEDGYVYITGRVKEMFTVGGFNVSPPEIEDYILKHPKVASVAVAGVPDERLGEVGAAFVKLKEGEETTPEGIITFCKGKIADIKVPRYVFFMDQFPLNPQGKVQKFKLREKAVKELGLKEMK